VQIVRVIRWFAVGLLALMALLTGIHYVGQAMFPGPFPYPF
jgi:hypothetical protein